MGEKAKQIIVKPLDANPTLKGPAQRLGGIAWPKFLYHSDVRNWRTLFTTFAGFQIVLCEPAGTPLAVGHTIPIVWDGTIGDLPASIDAVIERAVQGRWNDVAPTALAALAAIVAPAHRRKGLSSHVVRAMAALAARRGLRSLVAPVRPTLKSLYPLMPMETYVALTRSDGSPFDPWIRVHWKLGAAQLSIGPKMLVVEGTVREWEKWTRRKFPNSGSYLVAGALEPITIDHDRDLGRYEEPNVWMQHKVGASPQRSTYRSSHEAD